MKQLGLHNRLSLLTITFVCVALLGVLFSFDAVQDFVFDSGGVLFTGENLVGALVSLASESVTTTILHLGYAGIFLLMFLESTSIPIPSEVILPFSGYLSTLGVFNPWIVVLLSTVAGILGSIVDYYVGRAAGRWGRSRFVSRFGSYRGLERANRWFELHGAKAVFFTRMIPGFRTVISFPAGATGMSLPKFIGWTALGCFLWSSVLVYLGVFLGINWSEFLGVAHYLTVIVLALFALGALWFVIRQRRERKVSWKVTN